MTDKRFISARHRAAFTLIELLMVIVVVGILAGILLLAISGGTKSAKNARVVTEIDQLQTAIETYKTDRGAYPPTLGARVGETLANQGTRVQRHVAKVFPRYTSNYDYMREQVAIATKVMVNDLQPSLPNKYNNSSSFSYTNSNNDANGGLDINNLDPAESLVFWLGGIPDLSAETKLVGFRADAASPFYDRNNIAVLPSDTSQQRTPPAFPFDPKRLVDYDEDGWFEYLPAGGTKEGNTPPFVYFDQSSYVAGPAYPYPSAAPAPGAILGPSGLESLWGNCIPYAADPAPTVLKLIPTNVLPLPAAALPVRFVNSNRFQIIAAGIDNKYDAPITTILAPTPATVNDPWWFVPEYFPSSVAFQDEDKDNLSNFARGPLGEEAPQQ